MKMESFYKKTKVFNTLRDTNMSKEFYITIKKDGNHVAVEPRFRLTDVNGNAEDIRVIEYTAFHDVIRRLDTAALLLKSTHYDEATSIEAFIDKFKGL